MPTLTVAQSQAEVVVNGEGFAVSFTPTTGQMTGFTFARQELLAKGVWFGAAIPTPTRRLRHYSGDADG